MTLLGVIVRKRRMSLLNPVVGLDVAKGESQVQAFLDKSKPFGKSFSIKQRRFT